MATLRTLILLAVSAVALQALLAPCVQAADDPGAPFIYLPPAWSQRVVFYHSFGQGAGAPEINLLEARVEGEAEEVAEGFAGPGYPVLSGKDARRPLRINSPRLSPHRPLTVMFWWRLDQEMQEDLTLCLFYGQSPGRRGYIANAVHGKSGWCALPQPTYISQVHGYEGLMNHHNSWGGRVWPEAGQWRHWALTATGADRLTIFWDGRPRETIALKGRPFREGDVTLVGLGEQYSRDGKPDAALTFDEVIVADRALTPEEIAAYVLAAQQLRARAARRAPRVEKSGPRQTPGNAGVP